MKDGVEVTNEGPIYGREAIEKHYADLFQKVHFSNHLDTPDQTSPHAICTDGNTVWENGEWSVTYQVKGRDPAQGKGYYSLIAVREDGVLKKRLFTWNITPHHLRLPKRNRREEASHIERTPDIVEPWLAKMVSDDRKTGSAMVADRQAELTSSAATHGAPA